jgi:hypothetical protein
MTTLTIWKYQLDSQSKIIGIPRGAQILALQMQDEFPVIWALVDPSQSLVDHQINIYDTGQLIPEDTGRYIGTFQEGWYVGHVFDWTPLGDAVDAIGPGRP